MIHPNTAIVANVQQLVFDRSDKRRLAIRRETHDFVFTTINLESRVVSERAVQESQTVRVTEFLEQCYFVTLTNTYRTSSPFANTIDGEYRSMFEGRWIEGAGRVTFMMITK